MQSSYPQHQYIISGHSPDVIFSSNASGLFSVQRNDLQSTVTPLRLETAENAREVAGLLGFSLLDVFGNDRILWVEGQTEEIVFPLILEAFDDPLSADFGVCAVAVNSSLTASATRRNEVLTIYDNAGKRLAPLLKGMAFGLDREKLSDESVPQFERSHRKLRFLKRRCLENYLILPWAIRDRLAERGVDLSERQVSAEIARIGGDRAFGASSYWKNDTTDPKWLRWIDGARLLEALFRNLTSNQHDYRKTEDSVAICRIILGREKDALIELKNFIVDLVRIAKKDTRP